MPMVSITDWYHGVDTSQLDRWQERRIGPNKVERTRIEGRSIIRGGGTAEIVHKPGTRTSQGEAIELRDGSTAFTVNLGGGVRAAIEDELRFIRREVGRDYEAGGYLWTRRRPGHADAQVTITSATNAGASRHSRTSLELEPPLGESFSHIRQQRFVGDWHTHGLSRSGRPSAADMRAWAGHLDQYVFRAWVGLVVTPDPEGLTGWSYPRISAWITHREGSPSKLVCERARVVE